LIVLSTLIYSVPKRLITWTVFLSKYVKVTQTNNFQIPSTVRTNSLWLTYFVLVLN